MTFDELKEKAHSLPLKPGVYIMQDAQSTVIYVGKAKALKNRVSQYFQDSASHTEKTRAMVSQIDHFDVIIADSEFEALVLECSLIKRHQPRYNILLKDSKGYPYIRLSNEAYPRFSLASRAAEDGARYFGPYGGRHSTQGCALSGRRSCGTGCGPSSCWANGRRWWPGPWRTRTSSAFSRGRPRAALSSSTMFPESWQQRIWSCWTG